MGALAVLLALAAPSIHDLQVSNGSRPFAGDGRLLTTVSPNGDGFRDRAIVSFRLDRPATVKMDVLRTDTLQPGRADADDLEHVSTAPRRPAAARLAALQEHRA